jgi:UDP-4-amino-4-deoxy-L-arabinose formyltransferase/UDP-glucuronic acid dehydrogenase (UDP-4-keto-hexauronic acid decarboxylating)
MKESGMKAVLFGYHEMACTGLKALMDAGFTVSALFTHADPASGAQFYGSVARMAERHNIPVFITEDVNTAEWQARIASLEADYLFCFSYRQVLSEAILSSVKKGAYNVHAALLPAYRGRAHLNWVIIKGETQTGVTLHRMIKRPDAGPILAQKAVEIHPQDNALALHTRLVATTAQMLPTWLDALVAGELTETPQDERAASCFGSRKPEDGQIHWQAPARDIHNLVRALAFPWPGAFTLADSQRFTVWQTRVIDARKASQPGEVVSVTPLVIGCGQGQLEILQGQSAGGESVTGTTLAGQLGLIVGQHLAR